MKKKLFVLLTLMTWLSVGVCAQSLGVFTADNSGKFTNVRNAPVVFKFKEEEILRPMDIKGDWVKVQTYDGKYTGWIEAEWLCGNALTNCC